MPLQIDLPGPVGLLEAQLEIINEDSGRWAIICHPHPLFAGTILNKVVSTLSKAYVESGINTLIFNYRGVGKSQGEYGDMAGEVADCLAAFEWLHQNHQVSQLYLAGFSFGAYIAAQAAFDLIESQNEKLELMHLALIAPSVENSPFDKALPISVPCLVVGAEADELIPIAETQNWVDGLYPPVEYIEMPETSHFFHGKLLALRNYVKAALC